MGGFMKPLDNYIKRQLDEHAVALELALAADVMAIISPILPGLEVTVRYAIEQHKNKQDAVAVILETNGGIVEVVERIVGIIRHHYKQLIVVVPDRAMSAGTIFALSADQILMDYFSCLGPIDPQVEKDGRLVPALAYLSQFNRLNERAVSGELTTAEYALLNKLDLGELYQFEQARELSIELLKKWLSLYKFANWTKTESQGTPVTEEMRESRAKEVAEALNDNERWHSHGRGIDIKTLQGELRLKIEDYSATEPLRTNICEYIDLLRDYMQRQHLGTFVHSRAFF